MTNITVDTANAATADSVDIVLFFVDTQEEYDEIAYWRSMGAETGYNLYNNKLFKVRPFDEFNQIDLSAYRAIALPFSNNLSVNVVAIVRQLFDNGTIIYLYGDLTIQEYKHITGLEMFALDVDITNLNDFSVGQTIQSFDGAFKENEIFNIIGFSEQALLCKIYDETISAFTFLFNIAKNFEQLLSADQGGFQPFNATIVRSGFNFTSSWTAFGSSVHTVRMDYTLYQNLNEYDPNFYYFGISTNTWVTSSQSGVFTADIRTRFTLPNNEGHFLDSGPASQANIGSLGVSVGFGSSGPSASIGFSVNLSDIRPTIDRDEQFHQGWIDWRMTRRTLLPINLGTERLRCVATWASPNNAASIDVRFRGGVGRRVHTGVGIVIGFEYDQLSLSGYTTIPIRFSRETFTTVSTPYGLTITGFHPNFTPPPNFHLTIPRYINGQRVASVANHAFWQNQQIRYLTIEEGVYIIGRYAFARTNLRTANLPASLEWMRWAAFDRSYNLHTVNFAANSRLHVLESFSLSNTNITTIFLPASLQFIDLGAFYQSSNVTTVQFLGNSDLIAIGDLAFYGSNLQSIYIGRNVSIISQTAFLNVPNFTAFTVNANNQHFASLNGVLFSREFVHVLRYPEGRVGTSFTVPNTVLRFSGNAFRNARHLQTINIERQSTSAAQVTALSTNVFTGSSVSRIVLPNNAVRNLYAGDSAWRANLPNAVFV